MSLFHKIVLFSCLSFSLLPNGISFAQKGASDIATISVFGDATAGKMAKNTKQAYLLGQQLAKQNKEIVLNGATQGIIGALMEGAYESGGKMTLVALPEEYDTLCPEKHFCRTLSYTFADSLSEQEMLLKELGDVIVILPGGWEPLNIFMQAAKEQAQIQTAQNSSLQELKKEVAIGKQPVTALSRADLTKTPVKPIIFLNSNHYWDNLRYMFDEMKRQKVLSDAEIGFIGFAEKPRDVLPLAQKLMKNK